MSFKSHMGKGLALIFNPSSLLSGAMVVGALALTTLPSDAQEINGTQIPGCMFTPVEGDCDNVNLGDVENDKQELLDSLNSVKPLREPCFTPVEGGCPKPQPK